MFKMFFGMSPSLYRNQPSVRRVACPADCAAELSAAAAAGARQIWVDGPLTISSNITLGSASAPVLVVSNGTLSLQGPMTLYGTFYARGDASWTNGSGLPAVLNGALLAHGNWGSSGAVDLVYQAGLINILNNQTGSFVRLPGGWWNF
jgi:hypothetical protein